ncbi:MAG: F0F1 ATP synthase subunit gamma, partial [Muribaculaceae bacterium]|nr:F0F1 ATP synthase subunit gamma [Muribaculaceae bacterium]
MSTLRELKSRIGSVASTQKTTSAMKMISSAKMRKATYQLQRLSPYR